MRQAIDAEERARKLVAAIEGALMMDMAIPGRTAKPDAQAKAGALAKAFADFGINPFDGPMADTVETIAASRKDLQNRMLAGLTEWSEALKKVAPDQSARLEEVIDRADTDPWRKELRQAVMAGDAAALEALAGRKEIAEQPGMTVMQLFPVRDHEQLADAVEKLLRRAQRDAPAGFWTNWVLGMNLMVTANGKDEGNDGDDGRMTIDLGGTNFGSALPGIAPEMNPLRPELDEAIGFLRAAVAARPDAGMAWMALGASLTAAGHLEEAVAIYQRAVALFPESGQPLNLYLGHALLSLGRREEALPYLRRATRLDPADRYSLYCLGMTLGETGHDEEAREILLKAVALAPGKSRGADDKEDPDGTMRIEKFTFMGKEVELSEEIAHLTLALIQNGRGDHEAALASTQRALEANPDSAAAYLIRGLELISQGDLEAAKNSLQKALELNPDSAAAHNFMGVALMEEQDFNGAVAFIRRSIALDPKDAMAHCNLGACLGELGKLDEALTSLQTAIDLAPGLALAWSNLGAMRERQGRLDEAAECFRKAVSLDPGNTTMARVNLAKVLWNTGKHEESIAAFQELNDAQA